MNNQQLQPEWEETVAKWGGWALQFHTTYERLAPDFGYKTRQDTKDLILDSPNGKLMMAVMKEIIPIAQSNQQLIAKTRKETLDEVLAFKQKLRHFHDLEIIDPKDIERLKKKK